MQNSLLTASLLSPKIGIDQRSTMKSLGKSDDTFMNLLSERIQARKNSENARQSTIQKADSIFVREDPAKQATVVHETVSNQKAITSGDAKVKETSEESNPQVVSEKSSEEKDIEEEITSLEALVALLENLLAKIDTKTVEADPTKVGTQPQLISAASGNVDSMALLKALLEGNAEKLKALLGELDEGQHTPDIKGMLENIQEFFEKMTKEQGDLGKNLELSLEKETSSVSKEILLDQLKAQCSESIQKLKDKIVELKDSLNQLQEGEGELFKEALPLSVGAQLNQKPETDIAKNRGEPKTKEDGGKTNKSQQPQNSVHHETFLENEDSVNQDYTLLMQQTPQETSAMKVGKSPLPLSEKPLAQTVTNQVMMKVKLMSGENKQEMEMHLKPESLGKLSLKIIHERGEILAKITAENEQVKGIIESNMQLLKDALEKSGLSVQSLSVSVGNGEDKGQSRHPQESSRTGLKIRGENPKALSVTETSYTRSQVANSLLEQSSQIDLSA